MAPAGWWWGDWWCSAGVQGGLAGGQGEPFRILGQGVPDRAGIGPGQGRDPGRQFLQRGSGSG
ncbi:hypothetical protein GCM10018952_74350 [Streptosporangium vulgare]